MEKRIHKLDLYRLAVQHPEAEVQFLLRCYEHYRKARIRQDVAVKQPRHPSLLKEDFCGGAAVAAHFVAAHPDHQAMAVDWHLPTLRWADKRWASMLNHRHGDLHLVHADVHEITSPKVDIITASNFSVLFHHTPEALLAYFRNARKSLKPGGILVVDAFGGPDAMIPATQKRRISPPPHENIPPFTYLWQQRSYDALTGRIDCRIHFELGKNDRRSNAFSYDWRLWTLPELTQLMRAAGFKFADVWSHDPARNDGRLRIMKKMPNTNAWVANVAGAR